jgi:predicted RNA-binding Zn-ribbon protein involved in translation (DUF1610 family)
MPIIKYRCPETGESFEKGLVERGHEDFFPSFSSHLEGKEFDCPACKGKHIWESKNAFLEDKS